MSTKFYEQCGQAYGGAHFCVQAWTRIHLKKLRNFKKFHQQSKAAYAAVSS